jgi:beta-amylase
MTTINVMAPLVIGDPVDPNNEASRAAWQRFDEHLAAAKALGVKAVSTDIWWGLIENAERQYDFRYYDKVSDHIIRAGLKWMPILSLHQCGGNVGDSVYIPLPSWIWHRIARRLGSNNDNAARYVSEQGNVSHEVVCVWAIDAVLEDYVALFKAFQAHFAKKAGDITEINISLGPAGELRYPSYNYHDKGTDYPTRGALQCYSELARKSFLDWTLAKYGSRDEVSKAWGGNVTNIEPPRDCKSFFEHRDHVEKQYGKDLFDWYSNSLLSHGRKVITAALKTFSADGAAFAGIDIGAKVPGVHWTLGYWKDNKRVIHTRLAELAAGLIRTSSIPDWQSDDVGRGYGPMVALFKELGAVKPGTRVVLHFTCLEMEDLQGAKNVGINSLARSLVMWVGEEARRQGVPIKGENALNFTLAENKSWDNIRSALKLPGQNAPYTALTLLRMSDVVTNKVATDQCRRLCELAAQTEQVVVVPIAKEQQTNAA